MNTQETNFHPRCDCHECTQIRWKQSLQGQIETVFRSASQQNGQQAIDNAAPPSKYPQTC